MKNELTIHQKKALKTLYIHCNKRPDPLAPGAYNLNGSPFQALCKKDFAKAIPTVGGSSRSYDYVITPEGKEYHRVMMNETRDLLSEQLRSLGFDGEFAGTYLLGWNHLTSTFKKVSLARINPNSLGVFGNAIYKMTVEISTRDIEPSIKGIGWGCIRLQYHWTYKDGSENGASIIYYYDGKNWLINESRQMIKDRTAKDITK